MNQFQEMAQQRDALVAEAEALLTRAGDVALEGDDLIEYERITADIEKVNRRYEQCEKIKEFAARASTHEPGDDGRVSPQFMQRVDAWAPPAPSDNVQTRRDRGLAAITEMRGELIAPEDRSRVEDLLRRDETGDDAEYVTAASDPEYRRAFAKWLRDPVSGYLAFTPEEQRAFARVAQTRTAMTEGNASAMLPVTIDPTIILTNTGAMGSFRQFGNVQTISTSAWRGVTSAGVTASFSAEAAEVTDDSPTVASATVTPVRATAYVQASWELVQDANISDQLTVVMADAKKRLEESKFATGSGTNEPWGLVTRLAATTASRVAASTNGSFAAVDVFNLGQALPARYQENASFVSNFGWEYVIRNFAGSATPLASTFWADLAAGGPPTLVGKPYYRTSGMTAPPLSLATASNDDILVIGDFRQGFVIADRIGMSIAQTDFVLGSNRRPTAEHGFLAFWRTSSDLINVDAGRVLRI